MNATKRDRQALRRRLISAQYVINIRRGWKQGMAYRLAKEYADRTCSTIAAKEPKEPECPTNE